MPVDPRTFSRRDGSAGSRSSMKLRQLRGAGFTAGKVDAFSKEHPGPCHEIDVVGWCPIATSTAPYHRGLCSR